MHRLTLPFAVVLALAAFGCGGNKPAENATASTDGGTTVETTPPDPNKDGGADDDAPKKDECVGFDIGNIEDVLTKSSCEEPNVKPDGVTAVDLKGKLEVTVGASPSKVAGGGKVDLVVSFANKTAAPLTLHFRINPVPHFETEVYDAKGKRVDMPKEKTPSPPKGMSQPPPSESKSAKLTIAAHGTARARLPWEAVKMKWAPEKVRGTPAERGFPRAPNGPLPKGKYTVKVVTPLVGVSEGPEKEISTPKVDIEVGG